VRIAASKILSIGGSGFSRRIDRAEWGPKSAIFGCAGRARTEKLATAAARFGVVYRSS
jgi:hypothetical protein